LEITQAVVALGGMTAAVLIAWSVAWGTVQYARTKAAAGGSVPPLGDEVAALREQVEELRHQLADVHERIDFTERLLSRGQEMPRNPA
jgi:hypothetical protein